MRLSALRRNDQSIDVNLIDTIRVTDAFPPHLIAAAPAN